MGIERREFLKMAGGALIAGVVGAEACMPEKGSKAKEHKEQHARTYEKHGTGADLNALHGEVTNGFNAEVGALLKKEMYFRANNLTMSLVQNADGTYAIGLSVDLVPIRGDEKPDTIFEVRSTVWTGKGAKERVRQNYKKAIEPWEARMKVAYPDAVFRQEIHHGGSATLAHYECMLSGG